MTFLSSTTAYPVRLLPLVFLKQEPSTNQTRPVGSGVSLKSGRGLHCSSVYIRQSCGVPSAAVGIKVDGSMQDIF